MGLLVASWQTAVGIAWNYTISVVSNFAPRFIGAVIIFFLGFFISHWAKRIIEAVLKAIGFDEASQKSGLERFLKRTQVGFKAREIIGLLVYWFVLFVFFVAAVDILTWRDIIKSIDRVILYTPKVLIATFILAVGWLAARGVEVVIRAAVGTIDSKTNRSLGILGRYIVIVFAFWLALAQLGIPEIWIEAFLANLAWTITIALGIAFGWGAKDTVAKILGDWYASFKREAK